ncbi:tyrosine kinase domain protein [Rhizoctonia solani AG-3 Rhs1AP]|nr:tyrosine kinase domain protein [Rhizoctonia solani AG-3 Rhs1AP]
MVNKYSYFTSSISISQDNAIIVQWSSPELLTLELNPCSTALDIWATGCTLFEIISRKLPYCEHNHIFQVYHHILTNMMPGSSEDLLEPDFAQFWELVTSCWEQIPEEWPLVHNLWKDYSFQTSISPHCSVAQSTEQLRQAFLHNSCLYYKNSGAHFSPTLSH